MSKTLTLKDVPLHEHARLRRLATRHRNHAEEDLPAASFFKYCCVAACLERSSTLPVPLDVGEDNDTERDANRRSIGNESSPSMHSSSESFSIGRVMVTDLASEFLWERSSAAAVTA